MATKQCSECPATFETGKGKDRGPGSKTCSDECAKKRHKKVCAAWAARNPERVKELSADWYQNNREEHLARTKKRKAADPARTRATSLAWQRANRDLLNDIFRTRRKIVGGSEKHRRHLPALLGKYGYVCQIKGCDLTEEGVVIEVDHIVPVLAAHKIGWTADQINDISNLQPVCRTCNRSKGGRWDGTLPGDESTQLSLFTEAE